MPPLALVSAALMKSVRSFVREPTPLAGIEQKFAAGDPAVVRGTIFEMLRTGELAALWAPARTCLNTAGLKLLLG